MRRVRRVSGWAPAWRTFFHRHGRAIRGRPTRPGLPPVASRLAHERFNPWLRPGHRSLIALARRSNVLREGGCLIRLHLFFGVAALPLGVPQGHPIRQRRGRAFDQPRRQLQRHDGLLIVFADLAIGGAPDGQRSTQTAIRDGPLVATRYSMSFTRTHRDAPPPSPAGSIRAGAVTPHSLPSTPRVLARRTTSPASWPAIARSSPRRASCSLRSYPCYCQT